MNRFKTKNPTALKLINWDEIFRQNASQLKGLCRRYVGDPAIADDLVQETFITAIEKVATFKGIGSLEGWIRKIAVNKALTYISEKKIVRLPIETLTNPIEQETEMEHPTNKFRFAIEKASFSTDELLSVIDALPVHHKVVFNLYVLDGYTHNQIAQMMSISAGTSKSHLSRARKKAQELLYAKATEQQPVEYRRRSAWLLLLFFRPNYIDRIFRKGFGNYALPVQTPQTTFPTKTALDLKWTASLTGKAVLYGSSVSVLIIGGLLAIRLAQLPTTKTTTTEPLLPYVICPPSPIETIAPNTLIIKTDTLPKQKMPIKAKKVIIRKTIVIRDTIRLEKTATK